ncbi:Gfo/Idh/MocA family oxidoreductase [Alicyclobacillus curvatus]|jgi:D-xylose 1-dehydrogenase (NADP+, D-xylono-1,5-lactone-forming)|nr:Gfo/Idh/MocA family oxidoreductase [Alicyclobacillus curvatus]
MQKLRLGILSAANIARKSLIPAALAADGVDVVAIASTSDKGAKFLADTNLLTKDGRPIGEAVRLFDSYEAMLADEEIDAVYIGLPNHLHMEWSIKAADAGKHVLCEKPAALNAQETEAIIRHCNMRNVVWMEAFMYRFHPQYEVVRDWLQRDVIGKMKTIRSSFTFVMQDSANTRFVKDYGGGSLYDVGCYCVNVSQFLLGRAPRAVSGMMVETPEEIDEDFLGLMDYGDGQTALFHSSFGQEYSNYVEVFGTKGSIIVPAAFLPGNETATLILRTEEGEQKILAPARNQYQEQVQAFASHVFAGTKPDVMSHEDTLDNMRTIDALFQSAREHRTVWLQ